MQTEIRLKVTKPCFVRPIPCTQSSAYVHRWNSITDTHLQYHFLCIICLSICHSWSILRSQKRVYHRKDLYPKTPCSVTGQGSSDWAIRAVQFTLGLRPGLARALRRSSSSPFGWDKVFLSICPDANMSRFHNCLDTVYHKWREHCIMWAHCLLFRKFFWKPLAAKYGTNDKPENEDSEGCLKGRGGCQGYGQIDSSELLIQWAELQSAHRATMCAPFRSSFPAPPT